MCFRSLMKKFNSLVTLQEGISHKLYLWISLISFIPHLGCQSERVPSQCYGKLKGSNEKSFSDKLLLGPFRKALWQSQGVCRGAEQWYFKCAQLGLGYNKQPFWTASQALNPMCVSTCTCVYTGVLLPSWWLPHSLLCFAHHFLYHFLILKAQILS